MAKKSKSAGNANPRSGNGVRKEGASSKDKVRTPGRTSTPKDKIHLPEKGGETLRGQSSPSRGTPPPEEPNYYNLKRQAVEDLVTANEENSPPVSQQELRKYRSGPSLKLADWVKAVLIKAWMAGIVCYFFVWGLSAYSMHQWDLLLILSLALGAVTNLITNNILRFIAKTPGAYDRFMMIPRKEIWFLPLDLLYAALLVFCVNLTYQAVNVLGSRITGNPDSIILGVEPLLFGLFTLGWDMLFLAMKRLLIRIVEDAKRKTGA